MRTATVTLRDGEFAKKMSEMRAWLDQNFFRPTKFTYNQDREIIVISVDFQEDHQAEAFQSRFNGRQPEVASSFRSVQELLAPAPVARPAMPEARGTMAQACWYRLVAEEIRTESDNFGSGSARETMEIAAKGWEQLAEELEHRLALNGDQQESFFR
jgi:hypothetical protein